MLTCDEDEFRLSLENENENIEKLLKNNSFPYKKFIVTSGKNGCYLKAGKTIKFVESFEIQNFVDSIGSGDVFFSYFTVLNYLKIILQKKNYYLVICLLLYTVKLLRIEKLYLKKNFINL